MPPSWAAFGEGGDPYDYRDVIPAMARYLLAAGVHRDVPGAVYAYNHDWDYVALGGEHRRRQVAPNLQYPGSLERVALDPWDEAADEKGFLTVEEDASASA